MCGGVSERVGRSDGVGGIDCDGCVWWWCWVRVVVVIGDSSGGGDG